jgi:hypothetical protein
MAAPVISGSFFDLQHVNMWDAAHWTDRCRFWKEENWRALVADKVICYQYQGIVSRRTQWVDIGADGTQELYDGYRAYLDAEGKGK